MQVVCLLTDEKLFLVLFEGRSSKALLLCVELLERELSGCSPSNNSLCTYVSEEALTLFTGVVVSGPYGGQDEEVGVPQAWAARCRRGSSLAAA